MQQHTKKNRNETQYHELLHTGIVNTRTRGCCGLDSNLYRSLFSLFLCALCILGNILLGERAHCRAIKLARVGHLGARGSPHAIALPLALLIRHRGTASVRVRVRHVSVFGTVTCA